MAIRLADTARPNNHVDAEHLGTFPVAYAEDVWFADGTRLSEKTFDGQSVQVEELPLASAEELGNIYQYIGETGTYTKGYFYRCAEVPATDPTEYEWVNQEVQESTDKTEFEAAKEGIRNGTIFKIEWDEDVLANGNFADLKALWDSLGTFLYNNRGRLALITIDQYNFGFSDDDTNGCTPTLFCITPDRAETNEEYWIRVPYGSALSTQADGYGTGFFDIDLRFNPKTNRCSFAAINTILFKGTQLMSTGYGYNSESSQEVYINENLYNMTNATDRATAHELYHQGVTITIKLL